MTESDPGDFEPETQMDPLFPELGQLGNPGDGESESLMAARDRITEAVRAERERIRQLAIKHNAICSREPHTGIGATTTGNAHVWTPGSELPPIILFADLLGPEDPQP
jgi:hypothetical protein